MPKQPMATDQRGITDVTGMRKCMHWVKTKGYACPSVNWYSCMVIVYIRCGVVTIRISVKILASTF